MAENSVKFTQDHRMARFKADIGDDDRFLFTSFSGREVMNQCFEYEVEVICQEKRLVDFNPIIGRHCTITLETFDRWQLRYFFCILSEANLINTHTNGNSYRLVLRPWLWLLSKRSNALIFHKETAPRIIELVFADHPNLANFTSKLSVKSYPTIEYVAQYCESDMDFVCRLMEEHGISFYFEHGDRSHKLVMTDPVSGYKDLGSRPFVAVAGRHRRDSEHITYWQPARQFTTGQTALIDYDFKKPSAAMLSTKNGDASYEHGQLEEFHYPGRYVEVSDGSDIYAQARMDARRAEDNQVNAKGDCATFFPGCLMTLEGYPEDDQNEKHLVLEANHSFGGESYGSGEGDASVYTGGYVLMRADRQYAPPEQTTRPRIYGPQTAKVVGDGEIDCDEHGRILVLFHWDRKSKRSRRVRCAQVWAGKDWGGMFTPRVGMEVLVNFLEGDPDQPLVVGCVYNGENTPPYALPGKKNITGWKSNTTPGGGGYNEFVMDDTAGSELVRLHANFDMDSTVEHDEKREVKNDRATKIGNNENLNVANEIEITAGSKITIKCGTSKITMDTMSITLEASTIEIHAKTNLSTKSDLTASHEAGPNMTIKAMTVMIN